MSNIMNDALKLLNGGKNWYQGDLSDDTDTKFCSVGAVQKVSNFYQTSCDANILLCKIAREQFPDRADSENLMEIAAVNDHPDTVWEDIERIFEKAAVIIDEKVTHE